LVARDDIKENIATVEVFFGIFRVTPLMGAAKKGDYDLVTILYQAVKKLTVEERSAEIVSFLVKRQPFFWQFVNVSWMSLDFLCSIDISILNVLVIMEKRFSQQQ
jgi:hypothetical protein